MNFRRLELPWLHTVSVALRTELAENDCLWTADEGRQKTIRAQQHTQSIFLRSARRREGVDSRLEDIQESKATKHSANFPMALMVLRRVALELEGGICRAMFARLLPRAVVYPHIDQGSYYSVRDRYHIVIESDGGSIMRCGGEQVIMQEGELWWLNNKALHDSENPSDRWRTHLIFDVEPAR